ncbi:hypothetical protein [Micromonospora craniellae]|uniref:Uncharacterized protein n=1 Tax=Micromonospora craniellae TaxID=2294034 RepID=A0A372G1T3_9ACTN|nr:hypothetical protein [Micromonospora craniellae]QOC89866.1 hypothetical protein ID554_16645 [Micromonospora craniellae]RFS47011.1 hypothetical protein D0Q02_07560 [Micromonospora craniellae]
MSTPSTTTAGQPPLRVVDVRDAIERLRESCAWLWLLMVPGRERRPGRPVDEEQAEILEARGHADRAYRSWNLSRGMGALAPSPAAARLDVVDAQAVVHRILTRLARSVAAYRDSSYVGGGRPVDVLDWLTVGGPGRPWVVDAAGDAWRAGVVDDLHDNRDAYLVAEIAQRIAWADEVARSAAGVVAEPVRPIEHRCPACRHRSLQLHHDGHDKRRWSVRCVRRTCLCVGAGCGCLKRDRRPGLPHAWGRGEMEGPGGLATAVAIARRLDEQGRPRPTVRSTVTGHGGWSDRRTGAA